MKERRHAICFSVFPLSVLFLIAPVNVQLLAALWPYATGAKVDSSPAIGWDGAVYFGSDDHSLYVIEPDGSLRDTFLAQGWIDCTPAIAPDGTVYFGDWNFTLHALDPELNEVWTFDTFDFIHSSPAIGPDGTVYFGSGDFSLYALDPADGSMKWSFPTDAWIDSSPAVDTNGTIYFGSWDGYIYSLSPSGLLLGEYFAGDEVFSSPAIGADGTVFVGAGNKLLALSAPDLFLIWEYPTDHLVDSSPAIGPDGTVYVGSGGHSLYALNPEDGSLKWPPFLTGGRIFSSPAVDGNGNVYIASRDGYLYSISSEGAENWKEPINGPSDSSPILSPDGIVYVGSRDNHMYAFSGGAALADSSWPAFCRNATRDGSPPPLFATWLAQSGLPPEDQGPLADPEGIGIPNLLRYALGGSNLSVLPPPPDDFFYFRQDVRRTDLLYQPQFSQDLQTWEDLPYEPHGAATGSIQMRRSAAPFGAGRGYFRLQVTRH